jgi:hypothetical protein
MFIEKINHYDGMLLHNRFAYKFFKDKVLPIGNIIAFRGKMEVLADGMIDQEDVDKKDYIWSDDSINFLWEIPLLGDTSYGAVCYQRLFCANVGALLGSNKYLGTSVDVRGDDIYVIKEHKQRGVTLQEGKCSVSITHVKSGAALGHLGINIVAGVKAPIFAYSTQLNDEQVKNFIQDVINLFYSMNDDIFVATSKIISH